MNGEPKAVSGGSQNRLGAAPAGFYEPPLTTPNLDHFLSNFKHVSSCSMATSMALMASTRWPPKS